MNIQIRLWMDPKHGFTVQMEGHSQPGDEKFVLDHAEELAKAIIRESKRIARDHGIKEPKEFGNIYRRDP